MANSYSQWIPKDYLRQYYATSEIADDEQAIFEYILNWQNKKEHKFEEMLEFGIGPTIHHLIPFAPLVEKIFIADYLQSNLDEIQNWLENRSSKHDWSPYIKGALGMEGRSVNQSDIEKRSNLIRKKIIRIIPSDIFKKRPLGEERQFPLVTSFYCIECATSSKEQWRKAMKNLSSLVSPGGWLVMSALRNTNKYRVGNKYFPSANVNENDIHDSLVANGFAATSVNLEVHKVGMWLSEGFSSIIVSSVRKTRKEGL
jgi:hypothetical protein